jgi:hypothetical protein
MMELNKLIKIKERSKDMRKILIVIMGLALLLVFGYAEKASAADYCYVNHCDGINDTSPWGGGFYTAEQGGCNQGVMMGQLAMLPTGNWAIGWTYWIDADFYPYGIYTIIRDDFTWSHYRNIDGALLEVADGDWAPCTLGPDTGAGLPSSYEE